MRTVLMVLFDEVQSLDVIGPLEVFTGANTWRASRGDGPGYDIRTASLGGRAVRTSSGLRVTPGEDLREFRVRRPDLLIVPGGEGWRRPDPELVGWLRVNGPRAGRLVSVCTGAFLLAEAEQTARSCGYGTPEAMRRAFIRALGVSPGEYRRRFRPAQPPQLTRS